MAHEPLVTICDKLFCRFVESGARKCRTIIWAYQHKPLFDTGGGTGVDHVYERP